MSAHLEKYVQYIRNTGRVPLRREWFDEDWDPVGPRVRGELVAAGLVSDEPDGLRLSPSLSNSER